MRTKPETPPATAKTSTKETQENKSQKTNPRTTHRRRALISKIQPAQKPTAKETKINEEW